MLDEKQLSESAWHADGTASAAGERLPAPTSTLAASSGWRVGAVSSVLALAANLVILGVAKVGGADMEVLTAAAPAAMTIGPWAVAAGTVLPLALASVLLVLIRGRGPRAWRVVASAGLAIGVLTVVLPLTATATAGTKAALALMHVATGLVWFVAVRRAVSRPPVAQGTSERPA